MDPLKLLNPSYLFDTTPNPQFLYFWPLVVLFILIFIGTFALPILLKKKLKHPDLLASMPARFREFALLGLMLTFLRDQSIPYVGMRIWIILLFALMIAYLIWMYRKYKKEASVTVIKRVFKETTDKYLPKSKKKKKKKRH